MQMLRAYMQTQILTQNASGELAGALPALAVQCDLLLKARPPSDPPPELVQPVRRRRPAAGSN